MAENNRVYEIAKAHGTSSKALLTLLEELGVVAKSHMSVLSDEDRELVEKHFAQLEAKGEKVIEKAARVEVEKARPKAKRMSAREKLEAKRREKEARKKAQAEAPQAETVSEPDAAPVQDDSPPAETPKPKPRLAKVQAPVKPAAPEPAASESTAPEAESAPEPAESHKPQRPAQRVDLAAIARAAAVTRAKIADDMRTKMAAPEPQRPAPSRGSKDERSGAKGKPAGRGQANADAHQPKAIDPDSIRSSVRKALGSLHVPRGGGRGQGPQGPPVGGRGRRKGGRSIREEKRLKVERQRAREESHQLKENVLRLTEFMTVGELAEKLEVRPQELIVKLMGLGVMATLNQRLEREQIELIVADYPEIEIHWLDVDAGEDIEIPEDDAEGEALPRPPVVTVMGHVDHGKTTLLDHLRKANVVAGEAGGITQHIGAYQVDTPRGKITFLDTPGHQAFTAMRARGARITDIVVIVVAADDKVMPQTVEAIDHARASNCPIIIAINKIDLPAADPNGVKQALMQHNVLVEEFGGDVQCVEISAKKGTNVDALLEAIMLQAELLELKAVAAGRAQGVVVEARKEPGRGAVFTALVTRGTLRVGDPFVVGTSDGRVRAMLDENDQPLEEAGPSRPALVLGASEVPEAGDALNVVRSDSEAKEIARKRQSLKREAMLHAPKKAATLESLFERMQEQEEAVELNLLVKGDVSGSVEAVCDALMNLSNEKVQVNVIHRGVGGISENDVMLAAASDAIIIGFNLRPDPATRQLAKARHVELKLYDIIYEAVDDVKKAMEGLLAPVDKEVAVGTAEVRETFRVPKVGVIAGCYVLEGEVRRNGRARVVRDQVPVYEGTISSLKRFKEDARTVSSGYECGIGIQGFDDIKVGDVIEVYEIQKVAQEM